MKVYMQQLPVLHVLHKHQAQHIKRIVNYVIVNVFWIWWNKTAPIPTTSITGCYCYNNPWKSLVKVSELTTACQLSEIRAYGSARELSAPCIALPCPAAESVCAVCISFVLVQRRRALGQDKMSSPLILSCCNSQIPNVQLLRCLELSSDWEFIFFR